MSYCALFGEVHTSLYCHALLVHGPMQHEVVCSRSTNTENEERIFKSAESAAKCTDQNLKKCYQVCWSDCSTRGKARQITPYRVWNRQTQELPFLQRDCHHSRAQSSLQSTFKESAKRIRWKFPFPWWQWLCCFLRCRSSITALQKCPIGWCLEALECLLAWGPWEEDIPSNWSSVALQQSAWWCVWNCCHRQAHCVKWTWSFIWWFILKNAQKRVEQTHIIHIIIYPYNKEQTWTQHKNKLKSKPYSILLSRPLCRIGSQ